jgi:hypothetical protein
MPSGRLGLLQPDLSRPSFLWGAIQGAQSSVRPKDFSVYPYLTCRSQIAPLL